VKHFSGKLSALPYSLVVIGGLATAGAMGCATDATTGGGATPVAQSGSSSGGGEGLTEAGATSSGSPSSGGPSAGSGKPSTGPSNSGSAVSSTLEAGAPEEAGEQEASTPPSNGDSGPIASSTDAPTKLPTAMGTCPTLTNGQSAQIGRMPVVIYIDPAAKSKPAPGGPLILYYHATASSPVEVLSGFGQANISKVTAMGGVVAAFTSTACPGCTTTDDDYWYVEDGPIQDTLVACAIQKAKIDTRHIHALGWSAGALHTMWVAFARSNYMASVVSYSGGVLNPMPQDPTNKVPAILTYGDPGLDAVIIDFNQASNAYYKTYSPMGYYAMMCHHPGGHEVDPMVAPVSLNFFMDHPYKVKPEPYATTIPSMYPSYCHNMPM
jgi:hypothetical protein